MVRLLNESAHRIGQLDTFIRTDRMAGEFYAIKSGEHFAELTLETRIKARVDLQAAKKLLAGARAEA